MWISNALKAEVDAVARIRYISADDCARWNARREPDQLRLMSGWMWQARNGRQWRLGIKSRTQAYIEAATVLLHREAVRPSPRAIPLRRAA